MLPRHEFLPNEIHITYCLKKNLNVSRPSEHPPVREKNVNTFRWDHGLQIQNLFMAFKAAVNTIVPRFPCFAFCTSKYRPFQT